MNLRRVSDLLVGLVTAVILVSLTSLLISTNRRPRLYTLATERVVQAAQPAIQSKAAAPLMPTPQVVVGTPEFYEQPLPRYTIAKGRGEVEPIDLVDTVTSQVTRLQTDDGHAIFGAMDDRYLLWWGAGVMHVRQLETGVDLTTFPSSQANPYVPPQMAGNWLAFGHHNQTGDYTDYTLFAANLATNELITLTRSLNTPIGSRIDLAFGISERLAAWIIPPNTIVVYDLENRRGLIELTDATSAFEDHSYRPILAVTPGESVITWTDLYGYDLITQSYFRIENQKPADWGNGLIRDMSRIHEENRILTWYFDMQDGTTRHVRAPLLDATPSAAPCIAGQNLVQNGDLESVTDHALWQQGDSPSPLIVNDLPPGLATGGQWAIRLGRYSNAQPAIQQTVAIPSGVKGITLAFDVRANSWDIWGGDQLQVDLIDPISGESLLVTPVQWTNLQLASGDWIPLQVDIQDWPGIDTPLQLVFRAQTDWVFPTDFTIDNIRLITACQ